MMFRWISGAILLLVVIVCHGAESDRFNEELYIKPLNSGHIYTYFQFTTQWILANNESCK